MVLRGLSVVFWCLLQFSFLQLPTGSFFTGNITGTLAMLSAVILLFKFALGFFADDLLI